MRKLVVVDKKDKVLGYKNWQECHQLPGILHRGFTVLVKNNKGEILLQKRSKYKPLWPLFWDGCSSHPKQAESYIKAAKQRLKEELGFTCPLKLLFKFNYFAKYKNKGCEKEICTVLLGKHSSIIRSNPKEIAEYRWISFSKLRQEIEMESKKFTPWFKKIIKKL